jgi:hypothetical protein
VKKRLLGAGCAGVLFLVPSALATDATFTPVAREFANNVGFLDVNIPVALADDGRVVFAAESPPFSGTQTLFSSHGGVVTNLNLAAANHSIITGIAVNSAGHVAFVSRRQAGSDTFGGVYRTTTAAAPIVTLYEELLDGDFPEPLPRFVALSENNTVAYSTIVSSAGAVYRGPVTGTQSVLRSGSGIFYNTQRLDVNDAGQVAVQMEVTSPTAGLGRAIVVLETPEQPLTSNKTAIEQMTVGQQPMPTINNLGQVAFTLDSTVTMRWYDPANDPGGTEIGSVTLTPGVYVTTPDLYGIPRTFTQVAGTAGPFESFGRSQINDDGLVVFEATLDGGAGFGIFTGDDPVTDKVVMIGDMIGPRIISFIELGELNNSAQFSMITSDFVSTDREVWVVTVPEPAGAGVLLVGALMVLRGRRR